MPPEVDDPVPFRGAGPWTPSARLRAAGQLRSRLVSQTSASEIATVGAEYLRELLTARTVTVSTLQHNQYHDLVSLGYLPPREHFYPAQDTYPASLFPLAVTELRAHQGYFTVRSLRPRETPSSSGPATTLTSPRSWASL